MALSLGVKVYSCRLGLEGNRAIPLAVRIPKAPNRNFLLGDIVALSSTVLQDTVNTGSLIIFFFFLFVFHQVRLEKTLWPDCLQMMSAFCFFFHFHLFSLPSTPVTFPIPFLPTCLPHSLTLPCPASFS